MAKHKTRTVPFMGKGDKPLRLPEPITFDTFAIILIEHELKKIHKEQIMYVVAHVLLKHQIYGSEAVEDFGIEEEADAQAKAWGSKVFRTKD
jgi:hypothetical protein